MLKGDSINFEPKTVSTINGTSKPIISTFRMKHQYFMDQDKFADVKMNMIQTERKQLT
jgi:hypothetical protein